MATLVQALATALVLAFVFCCVGSGFLQIRAWGRHALPGTRPSLRALREPEKFFDPIGYRQIRMARRLLLVGGVAYLTYSLIVIVSSVA